jgi:tetratricopeptide (TPR) repeat protein
MSNYSNKNFNSAKQAMNARAYSKAIGLLSPLIEKQPLSIELLMMRGEAYLHLEQFEAGLIDFAKVVELDNTNKVALVNFGVALIRCNRQPDAKDILEYLLDIDPENFDALINLCNVYQALGKSEESLRCAMKAIEIRPKAALAYNNLGTALGDLNHVQEAREAFATTLSLDPHFIPAIINLAQTEIKLGNFAEGARQYETALKNKFITASQSEMVKYYLGYSYLTQGDLAKGWDYYEYGFSSLLPVSALRSTRKFIQPRWDGVPSPGKNLLIWREQGIGDEIEFSTCLEDLRQSGMNIIVECEPRLLTLFQRTYPDFYFRPSSVLANGFPVFEDFDLQYPMGSLPRLYRRELSAFRKHQRELLLDTECLSKFKLLLQEFSDKKLVGLCWRSGLLSVQRNDSYTHLSDWEYLLQQPDFVFVNLQYDDCEAELQAMENKLGISIVRWSDLDLKNDLENVLALIKNLDAVVTVGTAVSSFAGVVATPTFVLSKQSWMMLGENEHYPWFDSVRLLKPEPGQHIASSIVKLPKLIRQL